jgi:hypothetical protein
MAVDDNQRAGESGPAQLDRGIADSERELAAKRPGRRGRGSAMEDKPKGE